MKKLILTGAIASAALALTQPVAADGFIDDITWVPQIGVQYKNLEFEQKISGGGFIPEKGDLDADLASLTVSFTAIYKKGYLSFKYEDSLDDTNTDSDVPFTNASTGVEREDYSLTAGYNVWNGLNVFVGYMDGETTFAPEAICPSPIAGPTTDPYCGSIPLAPPGVPFSGNLAQDQKQSGFGDYEQVYQEDGFFVGASYAWKISDVGTISASLAYADLDSEYKDNYLGSGSAAAFKFDGDATGLSYGINWSQPLSKKVGYYLDIRRQDYDIDSKDGNGNFAGDPTANPPIPPAEASSNETITTFTAGLRWFL